MYGKIRKTNARKTTYNDVIYDSKLEAHYAMFLDKLLKEKKIAKWERQVVFRLPNMQGHLKLRYEADMIVTDLAGVDHIIEVKGRLTQDNVVKYSFFQYYYGKKINLVSTEYNAKYKDYEFTECPEHMPWLS